MIRRIVLENFMSHSHTEIEPAQGLTVLIGPNNCGKSAVVSALQTLCSNTAGSFMVRHGKKECRVTVETDDGHTVTWRRNRDTVSYVIDGREVHRLGTGGTPDDLHALLQLPKVMSEDGTDKFDIHFGTQKSPIFLLNESERRAAMFFASSSDAEYLMRMQRRHQEKVKDAKRERVRLTESLTKLETELTALNPIAELSITLQTVVEEHAAVLQQERLVSQLECDFEQLHQQSIVLLRQTTELDCLRDLSKPPPMASIEPLFELIEQLSATESDWRAEASRVKVLKDVASPPKLEETETLEGTCRQLTDAASVRELEQQRKTATAKLAKPPIMTDTATFQEHCEALFGALGNSMWLETAVQCLRPLQSSPDFADETPLESLLDESRLATEERSRFFRRHVALERLIEPPGLPDISPLTASLSEFSAAVEAAKRLTRSQDVLAMLLAPSLPGETATLTTLIESLSALQEEMDAYDAQLADVRRETQSLTETMQVWIEANPDCPTCGAPVDPERLKTWGHTHG